MNSYTSLPLWRQILRTNFTDWIKFANFLELNSFQKECLLQKPRFSLNVPKRLADKIEKNTLNDPILKQFLPTKDELFSFDNYVEDPTGETQCRPSSKLLHKYQGRVLLVCTSACAMHCRYCFRQHFSYEIDNKSFEQELTLISEDPSIHEVILSGGDPLSLSDATLSDLLKKIATIPHIKKVRFHTRYPIGIPERIDASFLNLLKEIPLQFLFVVHVNHPLELDADVLNALKEIQKLGIPIFTQSVLLRDINDDIETLYRLCETLVNHGIIPYYLHQLDRVKGAAHFEVSEEKGRELIKALQARLPGYAVPKYVREIPGEPGKVPLT